MQYTVYEELKEDKTDANNMPTQANQESQSDNCDFNCTLFSD